MGRGCKLKSLQWRHGERDASQITGISLVCSTVCSGADQRKHQSSAPLAFVRGIHRWLVNSLHKRTITRKMFPFNDSSCVQFSTYFCDWCLDYFLWNNIYIECHRACMSYNESKLVQVKASCHQSMSANKLFITWSNVDNASPFHHQTWWCLYRINPRRILSYGPVSSNFECIQFFHVSSKHLSHWNKMANNLRRHFQMHFLNSD